MIPDFLPPLPTGFVFFGRGPLHIPAAESQMRDVAQWWDKDVPTDPPSWNVGGFDGLSSESWYALREGSSIALINGCDPTFEIKVKEEEFDQLRADNDTLLKRNAYLEKRLFDLLKVIDTFAEATTAWAESRPSGGNGVG